MRFSKPGLTRRATLTAIGTGLALPLASPFVRPARGGSGVVNVDNRADNIGDTTAADFTAETGIEVVYDTYASAEEMQAKMLAGSTGYDVVFMASSEMPRFIPLDLHTRLDKSRLPGPENMDPALMQIPEVRDPGIQHGVPCMWGSVGFTFTIDMIREPIPDAGSEDLGTNFNSENAAKPADCGISILDNPTDIMPVVLKWGLDGDTRNLADHDKVATAFAAIRPHIATFDNANYLTALPNREICVADNWSGDDATARARAAEAGIAINLAYSVPRTGAPLWFDMMCMPSDAPNPENASEFLAYMLRPEVIAACTNWVNNANPNLAANRFVDPAVLNNPAVCPDEAVIRRLWAMDIAQRRTRPRHQPDLGGDQGGVKGIGRIGATLSRRNPLPALHRVPGPMAQHCTAVSDAGEGGQAARFAPPSPGGRGAGGEGCPRIGSADDRIA